MKPTIEIKNLSLSFSNHKVFDNFNATISKNKTTCLLGSSGSGKTTLMRVILGLEKNYSGEISTGEKGAVFSAVFQEDRLIDFLNAVENVAVATKGLDKKDIEKALFAVGLTEQDIKKPALEHSGGMKRRIAIVRAVLKKADIYIMDEPFKGLDKKTKQKTVRFINQKLKGKTVIVITHDKQDIEALLAESFEI